MLCRSDVQSQCMLPFLAETVFAETMTEDLTKEPEDSELFALIDSGTLDAAAKAPLLDGLIRRVIVPYAVLGVLLSGIVQSICPKLREHLYEKEVTKTVDIVIMAVLLFLCTMYLVSSTYNPFIYFRF